MRFGIWRFVNAAEKKPQYTCTTTIPDVHNSPKDVL